VVFFLGFNISPDTVDEARADGKCRVTLLPRKVPAMMAIGPYRRGLLEFAQEAGDVVGGVKADEKMNVIFRAADGSCGSAQAADGAAEIFVKVRPPSGVDKTETVFGAEYEVIVE
jgi:hypothetical protein